MKLVNLLEKKFGKYGIPNLTYYLIAGQVVGFLLINLNPSGIEKFYLLGDAVLGGQVWRLITFLFIPFTLSPIFFIFSIYLYYILGTALEREWGSFKYMLYLLVSYLLTVVTSLIFSQDSFSNGYLYLSIFMAFAYLYPDFQLMIFFIIPIKMKWLAIISWIGIITLFISGSVTSKITILISLFNFILFFGNDIFVKLKYQSKGILKTTKETVGISDVVMQCLICKATNKDNKIFYVCSKCSPKAEYCEDHINNHKHKI